MNKVLLILVVLLLTVFPFFCFAQEAIEKSEKPDKCEYVPLTQEEYDEQKKLHPEYMEVSLEAHNQYGLRSTPGCDKLSFVNPYKK